jgi:hypothetical protein
MALFPVVPSSASVETVVSQAEPEAGLRCPRLVAAATLLATSTPYLCAMPVRPPTGAALAQC